MDIADRPDPEAGMAPDAVEAIDFAKVRRGYEPDAVRLRLQEAAAEMRRLNALVASLSDRVAELEEDPEVDLDPARVAAALGDEAARLLETARDAARERIERAEAEGAEITGKAQAATAAIVEEGRVAGRQMVVEARNVRERILADVARRRHEHRVEVEQLRVIRERLLESLNICRDALEGWVEELLRAESQAAAAAQRAGMRVAAEPEQTVGQIEAEIKASRMVGLPLDRPLEESERDDLAQDPGAGEAEAVADAADSEGRTPATDPAGPGADDDEVEELGELDELDGTEEYVEIVGYADETPTADDSESVAIYDMEAEAQGSGDAPVAPAMPERDSAAPAPPAADASPAPATDPDPSPGAADTVEDGVEAIFARLRAIASEPIGDTSASDAGRAPTVGPGSTADPFDPRGQDTSGIELAGADLAPDASMGAEAAPAAAAGSEPSPDGTESAGAGSDPSASENLVGAARAVAVGGISRRLKRLVVDEQGDLLDAVRRSGARAVRGLLSADTKAYSRAVRTPLEDFASDIDVSIDDIDLRSAGEAAVSVLVDPVRARLSELVDETDDVEELSSSIRSIYRESRARRASEAAEAAFAAGWPEPIT